MWKQKIGISIGNDYSIPTADVVKIVKRVGFDAISPVWKTGDDLCEIVKAARESGLYIQSLHAPFGKAADMWSDEDALCVPAKTELLSALDACVQFHIPVLVVHTWIGFDYTFNAMSLNYQNFDEIISYAPMLAKNPTLTTLSIPGDQVVGKGGVFEDTGKKWVWKYDLDGAKRYLYRWIYNIDLK